ncbi:MAG: NAD(+)/NADH kinase [Halolamina sp.]
MRVGIVAQKGNRRAAYLAAEVRDRLRTAEATVWLDEITAESLAADADERGGDGDGGESAGYPVERFDACDLVVSIGGDGTFLFAARGAAGTPILGVNLGEVGFLNAIGPADAVEAVLAATEARRAGELDVREAPRLAARSEAAGWVGRPAANEVLVQGPQRGPGGGVGVEVRVDGSLYSGGSADGVLVATPTGSTAYNLSEGGPLIHPGVDGLVVVEMAAGEGMPPLVVGDDAEVTVTVTDAPEAVVVADGREDRRLETPAEVTVERAEPPVRIAGPEGDFFEALGKLE